MYFIGSGIFVSANLSCPKALTVFLALQPNLIQRVSFLSHRLYLFYIYRALYWFPIYDLRRSLAAVAAHFPAILLNVPPPSQLTCIFSSLPRWRARTPWRLRISLLISHSFNNIYSSLSESPAIFFISRSRFVRSSSSVFLISWAVSAALPITLAVIGGSVWESNPPKTLVMPLTGFEVQAHHQAQSAPVRHHSTINTVMSRSGAGCGPCQDNVGDSPRCFFCFCPGTLSYPPHPPPR